MAAQAELPLRYEGARQEGSWLGASATTTSPTKAIGYPGQAAVQKDSQTTSRAKAAPRQRVTEAGAILEDPLRHFQRHQAGVRCLPGAPQWQARQRDGHPPLPLGESHGATLAVQGASPTPTSTQISQRHSAQVQPPAQIPFLAHSDFKNNVQKWVSKLIRQHRHVLIHYHLPTKTIQELPHPALKVLWNHMCKVTVQGRHWQPEPCKCHEFLLEHPRAEQHEGHVATGLETFDFCKGQSNLGAAFTNIGACNAFFPSKQRLHDQILDQLRGWLKHHLFPNDDRILESFETFFEEQWLQHKEQQRHEPRLTHRLIKHLLSALPDNYIIHNEDHLMIYCPNVYNQAAFNTWMDEKTFLLLDKSPEDIKEDMERQTPPVVRKHYKKTPRLQQAYTLWVHYDEAQKAVEQGPHDYRLLQHVCRATPQSCSVGTAADA